MRTDCRRFAVVCATIGLVAVGCGDATAERQAEVAERGAQVMPFDLEATTHTFTETADGGIQVVTADDPLDRTQIQLIREHLREERDNFSKGDFDDPARIHGHDMPGVSALAAGYQEITVTYAEVPNGAQLKYTTGRADLIDAIHAWFERQLMDHGAHAQGGS
jgi:hypothetical protein